MLVEITQEWYDEYTFLADAEFEVGKFYRARDLAIWSNYYYAKTTNPNKPRPPKPVAVA